MPVAPAIKGVLIASSLVAAAVAAYETNPNVRNFVDSTTYKAQLALEDFLENLEAEFNPDPHARLRRRQRQREMRAQRMGASAGGGSRSASGSESGARGVNIVITGSDADGAQQSQELRRRHPGPSSLEADPDTPSTHSSASASTFFSQPASTSSHADATSAATDLAGLSLVNDPDEEDIEVVDRELDTADTVSSEDLLELDPFADPLTPLPIVHDEEMQEQPHTPTSFTTYSGSGETILTPRTPRTPGGHSDDVDGSYFDDFEGREGESGVVLEGATRPRSETAVSVRSGVSSVGFATPDEDEEDWGRTLD